MHEIWLIIIRVIVGYLLLVVLMKFMGKREVGQLSLFDLLILLTIVDIMVVGIENYDSNYLYSVIPMVLIAIIQKLIAKISLKWVWFRNIMDGKEVVIIDKGKVNIDVMKQNGYNMDDLYAQLREKGYTTPSDVDYAILENSGKLSIIEKMSVNSYPLPIITSGKLNNMNLKKINKTYDDIIEFLKKSSKNIKDIYGLDYIDSKFRIVEIVKK